MSRLALAAIAFVLCGCPTQQSTFECQADSDCGTDVCTRNGECLPASEVYMVKVTWTLRGMPASATTCAQTPDFYIQFDAAAVNDTFGYAPVPCNAGQFTVDKLPTRFTDVELGVESRFDDVTTISRSGLATFNLTP